MSAWGHFRLPWSAENARNRPTPPDAFMVCALLAFLWYVGPAMWFLVACRTREHVWRIRPLFLPWREERVATQRSARSRPMQAGGELVPTASRVAITLANVGIVFDVAPTGACLVCGACCLRSSAQKRSAWCFAGRRTPGADVAGGGPLAARLQKHVALLHEFMRRAPLPAFKLFVAHRLSSFAEERDVLTGTVAHSLTCCAYRAHMTQPATKRLGSPYRLICGILLLLVVAFSGGGRGLPERGMFRQLRQRIGGRAPSCVVYHSRFGDRPSACCRNLPSSNIARSGRIPFLMKRLDPHKSKNIQT